MPLLSTLGAISARGIGFYDGSQSIITTQTFTSNTTWTAPSGVNNIISLTGLGSAGVSDLSIASSATYIVNSGTSELSGSFDYSIVFSEITNLTNSINNLSTVSQLTVPNPWYIYQVNSLNNNWRVLEFTKTIYIDPNVTATYTLQSSGGFPAMPTSGAYTGTESYSAVYYNEYIYGSAGSPTTALGYTFPGGLYSGGTGYPAVSATYLNILITPGQNYNFVIPSGGSVQIVYALPI